MPPTSSLQRLTRPRQLPFGPGTCPYPAGYPSAPVRFPVTPGFPLPFGCRHSLLGRPVPPEDSASLTVGLPEPLPGLDSDGVSTFHMCQIRPGRVPPIPRGGGVHTTSQVTPVDACRFTAASPAPPRSCAPSSGLTLTRSHQRFTRVHPSGLPLTCNPRMARESLGFTLSSAPRRCQRRTSGRGRATNTHPGLRHRQHRRPPTTYH